MKYPANQVPSIRRQTKCLLVHLSCLCKFDNRLLCMFFLVYTRYAFRKIPFTRKISISYVIYIYNSQFKS